MYLKYGKRFLDVLFSGLAIVVFFPFLLLIAFVIKLDSKGPILFRQKRLGKNKTMFTILKYRTMSVETPQDIPTHLLENPKEHITRVGHFLRITSLDELPQIFNIFVGKMSVIGPRPALWNQDDLIAAREKYQANAIRPGLTGFAQICGRDELPIAEKAKLDGYYVEHLSFGLDTKIFFRTLFSAFVGTGVVEGKQNNPNP